MVLLKDELGFNLNTSLVPSSKNRQEKAMGDARHLDSENVNSCEGEADEPVKRLILWVSCEQAEQNIFKNATIGRIEAIMWFFRKKTPEAKNDSSQTGLSEIPVRQTGEIEGNIVFVHGLGADSRLTWHWQQPEDQYWNENNFWPKWLGDELPGFRIWLFGYDAKKFFFEGGQAAPRYDQAGNLLENLKARNLANHPLWFVAHSLGGLVVKEMLSVAQINDEPIFKQVRGVVFVATPHVGSDLVKWGNIIGRISQVLEPSISTKELESHGADLRKLDEWYRKKTRIATLPFYEMYNTSGFRVVDEDSANPKAANQERPIAVQANHIEIAKCRSNQDLVYLRVKQFIEKNNTLDNPFSSSTLKQIHEETPYNNQIEPNEINHSDLYKQLKKLNFDRECQKVEECINSQMIGSFLICGEKKNGVEILLEILYEQKQYSKILIDLGGNQGIDLPVLWRKVAIELDLQERDDLEKILAEVVAIQKKQSILFVFKSINQILPQEISDILSEFWELLIKKIQQERIAENHLFLFLVDYQNKYRDTKFCVPFDSCLFPENFTRDNIAQWIRQVRIEWGSERCDRLKLDSTKVSYIFQQSKGIPYEVYRTIYGFFLPWEASIIKEKLC